MTNSPVCECGNGYEDAFHYLFICGRFAAQRETLCNSIKLFYEMLLLL